MREREREREKKKKRKREEGGREGGREREYLSKNNLARTCKKPP